MESEVSDEGSTSHESSPSKQLSSKLKLPAELCSRVDQFEFLPGSTLVKLTSWEDTSLFDNLINLNPEILAKRFSMIGGAIYFDDLNESPIHEAAVSHLISRLLQHSKVLGELVDREDLFSSMGNDLVRGVGIPDLSVRVCNRDDMWFLDPNFVVEVAYSATLSHTHQKVESYFRSSPGLMAALIVDIGYPWDPLPSNNKFMNYTDGKIALFYYERPPVGAPLTASRAISFGNSPLTAEDVARACNITGVSEANFRGVGVKADDGLCDRPGLEVYTFAIPAPPLVVDNPADELADAALVQLLHAVNQDYAALEMPVDLFKFKKDIVLNGVHQMNLDIAWSEHLVAPPRPEL